MTVLSSTTSTEFFLLGRIHPLHLIRPWLGSIQVIHGWKWEPLG